MSRDWDVGCESWVFEWVRELNTDEFLEYVDMWQLLLRYKVKVNEADTWL